ncbi:hypothetical protein ACFJIW_05760 [Tahibacter sp. UC22_41]|uniref:hypothetical protein n=1 Tax=Tahibacter sp. UC22_41 TaxID=3350178 RepID=UPI0036D9FB71
MAAVGAACNAFDPSKAYGDHPSARKPAAVVRRCRAAFLCTAVADHTFASGADFEFRDSDGLGDSEWLCAFFPTLAGGFFLLRKALAVGEMQQIDFCCFGGDGPVRIRRVFTRIRAAAHPGGGTGTTVVHASRRRRSAASSNR